MRRPGAFLILGAVVAAATVSFAAPAAASARPSVSGLSTHRGPYWGGTTVTVRGENFTGVTSVTFGQGSAWSVDVVSPTKLIAMVPYHGYGRVFVRVATAAGRLSRTSAAAFAFTRPHMDDPIQGGMTARQEQHRSATVRAHHHGVRLAPASRHWTPAMGLTALKRASSWIGIPYSWAGGTGSGPTTGVCAHNGGDLDCHVIGFDCSGLTLNAWWPYKHTSHHAATQRDQFGLFHPSIRQLVAGDLVYFAGYPGGEIEHTAIYAGGGQVVQAPESGEAVTTSALTDVIAASGVYRGATRPLTTRRQGTGPQITSITSAVSTGGGQVTITGRALAGVTTVSVGHTISYSFIRKSAGRLVLTVPAHRAGTATIAVSNAWGTVRRALTYVAAPSLTTLSPSTGSTAGGTLVTVSGHNLTGATKATVGGVPVAVHVLGSTRATVTMPAHATGGVPVVLTTPQAASNALTFTYAAPPNSSRSDHSHVMSSNSRERSHRGDR